MLNNADLTELTKALLFPTTPEEMLALADDALRVLPGGAHGDNSINDAPGFVFSSVVLRAQSTTAEEELVSDCGRLTR